MVKSLLSAASLIFASSLVAVACGQTDGSRVALKGNIPRTSIGERALKTFGDFKSDEQLTASILGASAETTAASAPNAANVSVRMVLRGSNGELVALHGTAANVNPKEKKLLTLDSDCANPRYDIEVSCRMEYCGTLGVRLIEKADGSVPSMVDAKAANAIARARQAGMVFTRDGAEKAMQQRRANRKVQREAVATGENEPVQAEPVLKMTPGPMKRTHTARAAGRAGVETSFEDAVATLRKGQENISIVNACVDQTGESAPAGSDTQAPGAEKKESVTDIQPVDASGSN